MVTIQGEVEEIIYRNELNGYTICSINCDDRSVTVVGNLLDVNVGEVLKAVGKWVSHPSYGEQFKAELCERELPKTENSLIKFLSSGIIKGIREATARKIVNKFGDRTLEVIRYEPEKLAEVKGISLERALAIGESFQDYGQVWNISSFLQQYGISPLFINKIYKRFGTETIDLIKKSPYKLVDEIPGIGFETVDKIALSLGIESFSQDRIGSYIKYRLIKSALNEGHTFLPLNEVLKHVSQLLGVDVNLVYNAVITLSIEGNVVVNKGPDLESLALKSLEQAEANVARRLIDLSLVKFDDVKNLVESFISDIEKKQNMILEKEQRDAVIECLQNGVTVITGGPGTGKTTVVNTIVQVLERMGLTYVLTAPTGRAAKRLSEASGREAKTIHRLLELGHKDDNEASFLSLKRDLPVLQEDVVIVDEASMVDVMLMNYLVNSIVVGTRLIIVGDADQLPAVGPGNVLKDIINSGVIKVVKLTKIFRQADESTIVVNAHRINKGEYPIFSNGNNGDFYISKKHKVSEILEEIISLCSQRLPQYKGYVALKDIQVITPTKKGLIGSRNLNQELQKVLNPPQPGKSEIKFRETVFRERDKVMQIKNNYELTWEKINESNERGFGIFNGDIGVIEKIDENKGFIRVIFDDKVVEYGAEAFDELELGYAITVHKSQGSEFPVVVMPVFKGLPALTTRNLLYTGITRAKEMVILVGREEDVRFMVDNYREIKRYSSLKKKLIDCIFYDKEFV